MKTTNETMKKATHKIKTTGKPNENVKLTLRWQRFPVKPRVHLHENPPIWSVHSPLFKHGFESHSLYSKLHNSPEKPAGKIK